MHGYGRGRVIRSLLAYPCKLSARAIIATLPDKIKQDSENEVYRVYVAENLRIIGENTAKSVGGNYMPAKFTEIINPKPPEKEESAEEVIARIKNKVRRVREG